MRSLNEALPNVFESRGHSPEQTCESKGEKDNTRNEQACTMQKTAILTHRSVPKLNRSICMPVIHRKKDKELRPLFYITEIGVGWEFTAYQIKL